MPTDSDRPTPNLVRTIEQHFESSTPREVVQRTQQLLVHPEPEDLASADPAVNGPALIHPRPDCVPLQAYLACALSGLSTLERSLVFHLSDMVNLVCKELDIELYEPRKKTDPVHNPDLADSEVFRIDRDRVVGSDLLIHLCHFPSTGSGEELNFAYNSLVPIVLIAPGDQRVSRMITGIPGLKIEVRYREPEQLRTLLAKRLLEIRPFLEQRKLTMENFHVNLVGQRIKDLRLDANLTREELARMVGLTPESLAHIEDNVDTVSNPSLTQLRAIATGLKTTLPELVVADMNRYVMSAIQSILYDQKAARFPDMSLKDRNKLLRRLLYRVLDSLDQER